MFPYLYDSVYKMSGDVYGRSENSQDDVASAPQEAGGVHTRLQVVLTDFLQISRLFVLINMD